MDQPTKTGGLARGLFIAASVVQVLTFVAHTIAHLTEEAPTKEDQRQLADLMRTVRLDLPGAHRTMRDLFDGFGWHFSASMLGIGVLGLAMPLGMARQRFALIAALLMAVCLANSLIYFFIVPTVFIGLAAVLYGGAWVAGRGEVIK